MIPFFPDSRSALTRKFLLGGLLALGMMACKPAYHASGLQYAELRMSEKQGADSGMIRFLQPYADSVHQQMNKVIAQVAVPLDKRMPESTLGNLMADAVRAGAEKMYGSAVDAAFINYGGVRIAQVPAGDLTLFRVFEMMPFDNLLVVQAVPGKIFQEFLDTVAAKGGWPCSGVQFVIRNRLATEVKVGGEPLDSNKVYMVANSDYVVNGGDRCYMLKALPQQNKGYLVRDALIDYFSAFGARGEKLSAKIENRVTLHVD